MNNLYLSNATPLFLNNGPSPDFYSPSLSHPNSSKWKVESLELPELLKNPLIQQLYEDAQQASFQVMKDNEEVKSLWKENRNLTFKLQSVCSEIQTLKTNPIL